MVIKRKYPDSVVLAVAAFAGVAIGVGVFGIFALYGFVPLAVGIAIVALSVRTLRGRRSVPFLVAVSLAVASTIAFMLWGSEYLWAGPSCSQHPNQRSGQITYWSGASVTWVCVNGQPLVTRDTRPLRTTGASRT